MTQQSHSDGDHATWLGSLPVPLQVLALLSAPVGWWWFFKSEEYAREVMSRAPAYADHATGQIYATEVRGPAGPAFLTLQEYLLIVGPPYLGGVLALAFFVFLIVAYFLRDKPLGDESVR